MMTIEEIRAWALAHKRVAPLMNIATNDYVGARCCILNWLIPPGFISGAQAAEKYLKAVLACTGRPFGKDHTLTKLLSNASDTIPDHTRFIPIITTLGHAYTERYDDHVKTDRKEGYSSAQLVALDDLVVTVFEHIPIPEEVMCSMLPFHWLFEDRLAQAGWKVREWLMMDNAALATRYVQWRQRYDVIMDALHPNRVK
jgi:hypothetical protein